MGLTAADIADLVNGTLQDTDAGNLVDLSSDLQEYVFADELLDSKKVKYDSGKSLQINLMTDDGGQARNTTLTSTDNYNIVNVLATGSIPWRTANTFWAVDMRVVDMNKGAAQITDYMMTQRATSWVSWAKLEEQNFWTGPADGTTDVTSPFGVRYYIVYNATEGFNGGDPFSGVGAAGILTASQPRWKNYTANYTAISKDDLVRKIRKAMGKTNFISPKKAGLTKKELKYGMYTNLDVELELETQLQKQNDNLGSDLAQYDGQVHIRKVPLTRVPFFDSYTTSNPVYLIDWTTFYPCYLEGWYAKQTGAREVKGAHNQVAVDVDFVRNFKCENRRKQCLIAMADPASNI